MSQPNNTYISLRSRRVEKTVVGEETQPHKNRTSSPNPSSQERIEKIRSSIRETGTFIKELADLVDENTSAQNCTSLFASYSDLSISSIMVPRPTYNKEMVDLMSTNIPKFEIDTSANPALDLRSFIKACENVLSLFDEAHHPEFFNVIKFRVGYSVQERITKENFQNLKDLEGHLRSICHIKLNKAKLLNEIRNERQHNNEDVSHFVERLRKLIAQGRSEYTNDKEFEREASHTLKNSVKNELISIKLMDSTAETFEELAETAINRDSELHQRSYKSLKSENLDSQEKLISKLIKKN